jgi:hypothetical protein
VIDLIGRPYRLGATGADADGAIDCIHLVLEVHRRLGYDCPTTRAAWYGSNGFLIGRDLLRWWLRLDYAEYDGDVLYTPQPQPAFSVRWDHGCLYINRQLQAVAWCPIDSLQPKYCFRSKSALSKSLA